MKQGEHTNQTGAWASIPSPEEFQKRMAEMLRQQFGTTAPSSAAPEKDSDTPESKSEEPKVDPFRFDLKPRDVKAYLDRFVIRQDEAKKVLSVALCDHYHHVRMAHEGNDTPNYAKQNILLIGPTGVGKTYLIRCAAELIGVPFVKADATKFSETGYVGGDVEDMVRDLMRQADGDVQRAQYGIIYIDEIDKITAAANSSGRDVSGRGVQTNLLKVMEETEVPARSPNDIAGQLQAMMDFTQRGQKSPATINTRHILFIVSGAFGGLEKIVSRRLRAANIGFQAETPTVEESDAMLAEAQTPDFIEFGFEAEFIGRLPVRVNFQALDAEDLYEVLKRSEGSILRQYESDFSAYGIEVLFDDDGLRRIAEIAAEEQTGARGLMTICERTFREIKFELPSTSVKRFVVTRQLVDEPRSELKRLIDEPDNQEHLIARKIVDEFAQRFKEQHGMTIRFTDEAADALVAEAQENAEPVRDLCARKFKDYHFGLKLILQNSERDEFEIDVRGVREPDKLLSEWVVASYRDGNKAGTTGDL